MDFYIANAASTSFKPLEDINLGNMDKTFNLVIKSFVITVQQLVPLLKNRDSQILTISGIDTVQYCPNHGLLAAAKAALEVLTKYFCVELAPLKIHTKCINPGLVASDSTRFYMGEVFDEVCKNANQTAPHKGFVEPEDVAKIVLNLLRPEMNWHAGQTLYTDGGLSFMMAGFMK